jgi:hypothetical protein
MAKLFNHDAGLANLNSNIAATITITPNMAEPNPVAILEHNILL